MINSNIVEEGRGLYVEVDTAIYPETVIDKVLYWYSSEYIVYRKKLESSSIEGITLVHKQEKPIINWDTVISELSDKFIDYKNRAIILSETGNLRELFFAKAFANSDDFVEFEFKD